MTASTPSTRLDPVGRLRLPRRTTTIRAALVTVLLLTAAGVLYARDDPAPAPARADPPATAAPEPDPTPDPDARLPIPDGLVGVTVPLGDPASLAMLRPGDWVDLLAMPAAGGDPVPLADAAAVLAVDPAAAALLLALTPDQGRAAVSASATGTFAVIVRP
jgi:hypothetical protein